MLQRQAAEEAGEPVLTKCRSCNDIDKDTLDSLRVVVMFQGALKKTSLLAQLCNTGSIIVGEHIIAKNGVSNLRCINQVHLKETSLQMALLRSVVLQSIQQESCRRLNHALRLEYIYHAIDVNQRTALIVCELGCEFGTLLGIDP